MGIVVRKHCMIFQFVFVTFPNIRSKMLQILVEIFWHPLPQHKTPCRNYVCWHEHGESGEKFVFLFFFPISVNRALGGKFGIQGFRNSFRLRAFRSKISCEFCGKKYASRRDLDGHVNAIHMKLKPFVCPICGKSFSYTQHLHAHKKMCPSPFEQCFSTL